MKCCLYLLVIHNTICSFYNDLQIDSAMNEIPQIRTKRLFSKFEEAVTSEVFIDNTFFIKDLFVSNGSVKLITAPRGFGKSTNMDMVRRFLEISVDENGHQLDIKTTKNYNLFTTCELNICKDHKFFHEYFGQYPIVYIDYNPLRNVSSFPQLLEKLKLVISNTFSFHIYLIKNQKIWMDEEEIVHFTNHITQSENRTLDRFDISFSFQYLALLLKKHFRKKVFVLIDNCDAFVYNMIFQDSPDINDILSFMEETDGALLTAENLVSGAFLTGVLRVFRGHWGINVWSAQYLQEVEFSKYYGVTEPDLRETINRLFPDKKTRREVKSYIDDHFGGYRLYNDGDNYVKMYSISSVVRYLRGESQVMNYFCYPKYVNGFKYVMKISNISDAVDELLKGKEVFLDLYEAFYKEQFLAISNAIKHGKLLSEHGVEWFLRYLHRFGYLTPNDENKNVTKGRFQLPNKETKNSLLRFVAS
uniref:AAA-ATPase-like domain-containing protein n=1 Tax=Graphocephala atropunctata TaxID=36148 RepID=A0A1B6LET4_9HEMI